MRIPDALRAAVKTEFLLLPKHPEFYHHGKISVVIKGTQIIAISDQLLQGKEVLDVFGVNPIRLLSISARIGFALLLIVDVAIIFVIREILIALFKHKVEPDML